MICTESLNLNIEFLPCFGLEDIFKCKDGPPHVECYAEFFAVVSFAVQKDLLSIKGQRCAHEVRHIDDLLPDVL